MSIRGTELTILPHQGDPLLPHGKSLSVHATDITATEESTPKKQAISSLLFSAFCLSWMVPVVALLVLNFQQWIVGAGISCRVPRPPDECYPDILGFLARDRHERTLSLDLNDRDMLGVLQVVAKAIEAWFTVIATSIICDFAMLLATSAWGLPLRHLITPFGFPRLPSLWEKGFWLSSGRPLGGACSPAQSRVLLLSFVFSVISLWIVCNLMGPATAVLLIPTLGWSEIRVPTTEKFDAILSTQPPRNPETAPECDAGTLDAGNYSCMSTYSKALDELSSGQDLRLDLAQYNWSPLPVLTEYNGLLYTFNASYDPDSDVSFSVAPTYQALSDLGKDYIEFEYSQGNTTFEDAASDVSLYTGRSLDPDLFYYYRNTLDIVLHRKGPGIALRYQCGRSIAMDQVVSATQSVRCYNSTASFGTKLLCFRIGTGWNDTASAYSQFSIGDVGTSSSGSLSVTVYSIPEAILATNTTVPCLTSPRLLEECDWHYLFSAAPNNDSSLRLLSLPVQYVEYHMASVSGPEVTAICLNLAYLGFPDYVIEVSPDANSAGLVELDTTGVDFHDADLINVHPDWMLAAWAVSRSGTVPGNRAAAVNLISAFKSMVSTPGSPDGTDFELVRFVNQHVIASLHALTLVGYNTTRAGSETNTDPTRPFLVASKAIRVWAYGRGSRSVIFAATIAILGCITVLVRGLISLIMPNKRPSMLQLVAAALRYRHSGELDDIHRESVLGNENYRARFGRKGELVLLH